MRKLNVTDRQMDGRTGGIAISPVPRPTAPAGDKNQRAQDAELKIIIGQENVNQVKYTKFLGIYIDENFDWSKHIQQCINAKLQVKTIPSMSQRMYFLQHTQKHCITV